MEEAVSKSIMLTSVERLLGWGRKNSLWPFHFGLSCNGRMIRTRNPERAKTAHPVVADQDVFDGEHGRVTHMQNASYVRRRENDGIGLGGFSD